jgi:hypothetical protein
MLLAVSLTLLVAVLIHGFYPFILLLVRQSRSPLRRLPGPSSPYHTPSESSISRTSSLLAPFAPFAAFRWFLLGNLVEMHDMENTDLLSRWQAEYGRVFVYRGFVGGCRLMLLDDLAVAHVLAHPEDYPKPDFVRDSLATMAAGHEGLLTSEGEMHRRQKKILGPAFASQHVRSLAPVFWRKAVQLRNHWMQDVTVRSGGGDGVDDNGVDGGDSDGYSNGNDSGSNGNARTGGGGTSAPVVVDVLGWLGQATLDVIGLAGFGYRFGALDRPTHSSNDAQTQAQNPLAAAFADIFSTARKFRAFTILQVWFPVLRRFVCTAFLDPFLDSCV